SCGTPRGPRSSAAFWSRDRNMTTLRAHSSMAEQPAHNRLGLGSSPGGPAVVAGAVSPARTEGGLIQVRVAPLRGQPSLVTPLRGQPGSLGFAARATWPIARAGEESIQSGQAWNLSS